MDGKSLNLCKQDVSNIITKKQIAAYSSDSIYNYNPI